MTGWKKIEDAPRNGAMIVIGAWKKEHGWLYIETGRRQPYSIDSFEDSMGRQITTATHFIEIPSEP